MGATPTTDATWASEVLEASNDTPVLIDFWAEWCGTGRMVGPIVDEIADEKADQVKVHKLNVDENPATARQYGVMSIPTLLLVEKGEVTKRIVGAKSKAALLSDLGLG
jgi:thioredoxin 1